MSNLCMGLGAGCGHPPSIHLLEGWGQPFVFALGSDANRHHYTIRPYLYVYITNTLDIHRYVHIGMSILWRGYGLVITTARTIVVTMVKVRMITMVRSMTTTRVMLETRNKLATSLFRRGELITFLSFSLSLSLSINLILYGLHLSLTVSMKTKGLSSLS